MQKNLEWVNAKNIIYRTKNSSWFGTEYNMNIYRGCSHGCIYCDSRSDCYQNTEFDIVKGKHNALELIRNDLRRKVKKGVIGTGAMSDPYNPFEKEHQLTRNALELVNAYRFGMAVATKSNLVTRDIDILKDIRAHSPVIIKITITCSDDALSRIIEPNAPKSSLRWEAVRRLNEAGIFCGILMMPLLPFINDTEENILSLVASAKKNGAQFVYPSFGLTMRAGQREYLYEKLDGSFPGLREKYHKRFGSNYHCASPHARDLWDIFKSTCEKQGILYSMKDIIKKYKMGYEMIQLKLFD